MKKLLLIFCFSLNVNADTDAEHRALANLLHGLDQLKPALIKGRSNQTEHDQPNVPYDWIENDINLIKRGIIEVLQVRQRMPRNVTIPIDMTKNLEINGYQPLTGNYIKW